MYVRLCTTTLHQPYTQCTGEVCLFVRLFFCLRTLVDTQPKNFRRFPPLFLSFFFFFFPELLQVPRGLPPTFNIACVARIITGVGIGAISSTSRPPRGEGLIRGGGFGGKLKKNTHRDHRMGATQFSKFLCTKPLGVFFSLENFADFQKACRTVQNAQLFTGQKTLPLHTHVPP